MLDAEQNAVAVQRAERNRFQDQHVQGALQKVELLIHGRSPRVSRHGYIPRSPRLSRGELFGRRSRNPGIKEALNIGTNCATTDSSQTTGCKTKERAGDG